MKKASKLANSDAVSSPMVSASKNQAKTRELLSKIKVLIQCSICRDDIYQPVRTPCDHNFCSGCITKYLESRSKEVNDKTGTKLGIQCPNCKKKITKRSLIPIPQLRDLLTTIFAANDAYKDIAGHSVLGTEPVVFSARKRLPEPSEEQPSPPKRSKSSVKSKSKTVIEAIAEDETEKPKTKKKKEEGDVGSVKRKLLSKKAAKNIYSFSASEDEDGPVNKKAVTASSKKRRPKKDSSKQPRDDGSDVSSVSKKSRSSKSEKVPKKSSLKSSKNKNLSQDPKENGPKEDGNDEKEEDEEPQPPPSPKVKPKPLRKVSKPKDDIRTSEPSASATDSNKKTPLPTASSSKSTFKNPLSIRTETSPSTGRTKFPLISPLKRKDLQVDIDFDITRQSRNETNYQERLRETISKVSSSTPILSAIPRPTLRNTISPVTNGVALVMSDEDETLQPGNKSSNKTQEKSSNIDELLKEVEKKSIDRESDDDMQPIMDVIPNRNYSRRLSVASSDNSIATRKSDSVFNNMLRKQTVPRTGSKSIQTEKQADPPEDEDVLYKKLSKLFEALCTQHGVEGNINIEGIGRMEMRLTKGRNSTGGGNEASANDDHCLSQVVSVTRDKEVQTEDVEFKKSVDVENVSCQTEIPVSISKQVQVCIVTPTASIGVQTDEVIVKEPVPLIDIASQSTQTDTKDHVSVGREISNPKVETGVGSQNLKQRLNTRISNQGNNVTVNDDEDMGSDFSQSILDMLEEEDRLKDEELRKRKNANGEVISIAETPPRVLNRYSGNNTTLSVGEQTTMGSSRRSLMSSLTAGETILESDPEN